ncbi:MAG TPA: cupin domain-containing protein [Alphaproteobacteria bacterium]|nr:cupin domain-containing protein [Alphaproteobacteria bacterium]
MTDFHQSLRERSAKLNLVGLWEIVQSVEGGGAQSFKPHIWHWRDLRPLLIDAGKHISLEEADRRVIILSNPGAVHRHHSTNTLYVSCSIYNPGEKASVHRHTPNASRFVLEGSGGYTTIEGEKCTMSRGDLIVTPNGTWHDHGNEGDAPVLWVDVLDLPLVENFGSSYFEFDYRELPAGASNSAEPIARKYQTVSRPDEYSRDVYGVGGLVPTFLEHVRGRSRGTPMFVYRWTDTHAALNRLRDYAGSPYDGIILEYTNPANGEAVTTTMSFQVQLLRPGERTQAHRQTSSTAYCCIEGSGTTTVGDRVFEWGPNDMFVIPSWAPHAHANGSTAKDAILYSVSDIPALKRLGLYREEPA